jgi:inhibitor of cysteine peptidase
MVVGIAAAVVASGASASEMTRRLSIGETIALSLESNPSTGYQWAIDQNASQGLARVRIDDAGFTATPPKDGRPLVGAPGAQGWRVTALARGRVKLVLAYRRSWENVPPVRKQVYRFTVGR